ncbi:MAG: polysaccharide deacetylase family protein [Pseudomonadota bacterium]
MVSKLQRLMTTTWVRRASIAGGLFIATFCVVATAAHAACLPREDQLGVSRIVEIDPSGGPMYGRLSSRVREPSFLRPMEVVLTFDDGPSPKITGPILDMLDAHCTKATFFPVGRMAMRHPATLRDVVRRGHTVGGHTWSHPSRLPRLSKRARRDQVERGFAAVQLAVGQPVAPFFRFPGLNDSRRMLGYLQTRGIGSFTVDVVSNDSFIRDPERLTYQTMKKLRARRGGIVLFHDIKKQTVRALPAFLNALKREGFRIVHLRSNRTYAADPILLAKLAQRYRKRLRRLKPLKSARDNQTDRLPRLKAQPAVVAAPPVAPAASASVSPAPRVPLDVDATALISGGIADDRGDGSAGDGIVRNQNKKPGAAVSVPLKVLPLGFFGSSRLVNRIALYNAGIPVTRLNPAPRDRSGRRPRRKSVPARKPRRTKTSANRPGKTANVAATAKSKGKAKASPGSPAQPRLPQPTNTAKPGTAERPQRTAATVKVKRETLKPLSDVPKPVAARRGDATRAKKGPTRRALAGPPAPLAKPVLRTRAQPTPKYRPESDEDDWRRRISRGFTTR